MEEHTADQILQRSPHPSVDRRELKEGEWITKKTKFKVT